MNFSTRVKKELANVPFARQEAAECELYGYILGCGEVIMQGKEPHSLTLTDTDAAITRRFYRILKEYFLASPTLSAKKRGGVGKGNFYILTLTGEDLAALHERYTLFAPGQKLPTTLQEQFFAGSAHRARFLGGLFLGCGSVSAMNANPHLELRVRPELAPLLLELLRLEEIGAKTTPRGKFTGVYLKSHENITSFLAMCSAHNSALALESQRVFSQIKADTNRRRNCDIANITKSVDSGTKQAKVFTALMESDLFEELSDPLKETLLLRIANPECSLKELSSLMGNISKSTLNKRLGRLMSLYKENIGPTDDYE